MNLNPSYNAAIFVSGTEQPIETIETKERSATFQNLEPDTVYEIRTLTTTCDMTQSITTGKVRTRGKVLEAQTRITNEPFIEDYRNSNSAKYKELSMKLINEIEKGLSNLVRILLSAKLLFIRISSLTEGSVVVNFSIVANEDVNVTNSEIKRTFMDALNKSTVLDFDLTNTSISERDSCTTGTNDCSGNATCIRQNSTYTCKCKAGFNDTSPNFPGRMCEAIQNTTLNTTQTSSTKRSTTPTSTTARPEQSDSPGWRVTVIVLGCLLGAALLIALVVALALFCIKMKRGKFSLKNSDMLQKFSYKNL
eukprot:gi/632976619/ref/XP_007904896.1/ PREDICTED: uromodulin-like 1 [Callorhinchus milii]